MKFLGIKNLQIHALIKKKKLMIKKLMKYLIFYTTNVLQELKSERIKHQIGLFINLLFHQLTTSTYNINLLFQKFSLVNEILIFYYLRNYEIKAED